MDFIRYNAGFSNGELSNDSVDYILNKIKDYFAPENSLDNFQSLGNLFVTFKYTIFYHLAFKSTMRISDLKYKNMLKIGPLKQVFQSLHFIEKAKNEINLTYPLITKIVQINESDGPNMNDNLDEDNNEMFVEVVQSEKTAIEVIKMRVKMLLDNNLFVPKGVDGKSVVIILDGDKSTSCTKICIRILNTSSAVNSAWNVFPMISYNAKESRKFLIPIASNLFNETKQKSIEVNGTTYKLEWKLGGDLLFICEMLGLNNARSHPCIRCKIRLTNKNRKLHNNPAGQKFEERSLESLKRDGQKAMDENLSHFEGVRG